MAKLHELDMDHRGEFDEVFVRNAFVHVERMADRSFWIGIDSPGMARLSIRTGVADGKWYFNVEEDTLSGRHESVTRPACYRQHSVERARA